MTADPSPWCLDWPVSGEGRVGRAVLKVSPETFFVDEDLGLPGFPEECGADQRQGEGEHLCLRLEKCGDNTDYVARQLADLAGCQAHEVGVCGLKDRHAVTRQWFSIQRPGREAEDVDFVAAVAQRWPVLACHRFNRKLRRGDHRGNRFRITLVAVEGDRAAIESALNLVAREGCPNYFGRQRFGHNGGNLDRAIADAKKGHRPQRRRGHGNRQKAGLYLSAARSWLFNAVLAERVRQGNWHQRLPGEPDPERPTGPLWGDGGTRATEVQETLERRVVAAMPELEAVFAASRMSPERRPLVLLPGQLEWQRPSESELTLTFHLQAGQYATALIGNVFELQDASGLAASG
ncbi:MAG: tRNA pseudouridine(13) synthase TruD [Pseudomonadales bacterium]|nr:tRNA pseudouridine(13) synthase TruD [Pseudomonadales bacterium]